MNQLYWRIRDFIAGLYLKDYKHSEWRWNHFSLCDIEIDSCGDYPKFVDSFIQSACWETIWVDCNDSDIEYLMDEQSEFTSGVIYDSHY